MNFFWKKIEGVGKFIYDGVGILEGLEERSVGREDCVWIVKLVEYGDEIERV